MRLQVICENRPGIASEVLDILSLRHIDLCGIEVGPSGQIYLRIQNLAADSLQHLMPEIRRIKDVKDVVLIPYLPMEREHQEIQTLLNTLPDPVISIDQQGGIAVANEAAQSLLKLEANEAKGKLLKQWLKGFNLTQWLNDPEHQVVSSQLEFAGLPYLANFYPIRVPDEGNINSAFAGGVVLFRAPAQLGQQIAAWQKQIGQFEFIQAKSPGMKRVIRQAKKVAELDAPLLITGETGVGKELISKACHQQSMRQNSPFLAINCAGLPEDAAESELFGMEDRCGSITKGVFELAANGTVFLQEVGELPLSLQAKFLRLLQDGSYRRVGSEQEIQTRVRIICSTQQDLPALCQSGQFREDLYYRLHVLTLNIPPLRNRRDDILPLTRHFLNQYATANRRRLKLSDLSKRTLEQYDWPGNVRQLQNAIQQAATVAEGSVLEPEHFQLPGYAQNLGLIDHKSVTTLDESVRRYEAELLRTLYPAYPSSRKLAQRLGISHTAVANKLREYGIGGKSRKSDV